jgi:5-formyltetrahydrofolate cyclo-ligase
VALFESMLSDVRKSLRASLRLRRRALTGPERTHAAQLVALNADRAFLLRAGWRVAVYASLAEEVDTGPLIALARSRGCEIFLPRIDRNRLSRRMRFVQLSGATGRGGTDLGNTSRGAPRQGPTGHDRTAQADGNRGMAVAPVGQRVNRLGITEPQGSQFLGARWFDVVFLPLVGFDVYGLRLGMGGGYYDRAFAFRRWRLAWQAPRLIGLGYSFQQVERIAAATHDVRLDAVITERGVIRCATG